MNMAGGTIRPSRLSVEDKILFSKRLSILLGAGMPIAQGLRMLGDYNASKPVAIFLRRVTVDIESGQCLSVSAVRHCPSFGGFAASVLRVGELSGTLHANLNYLADDLKKKRDLRKKVFGALLYPACIIFATIGMSGLLTMYVLPKILPVFQGFKFRLPITTRILLGLSSFLSSHPFLIIGGVVLIVVSWAGLMRLKKIRLLFDRVVLSTPFVGNIFRNYHLANFCRSLGLLMQGGMSIVEAIQMSADAAGNSAYCLRLHMMAGMVGQGELMSSYMRRQQDIFPPTLYQMLSVGEVSGNLSGSLLYLGEVFEGEVDDLTKNLSSLIEPVLMVVMGLIVGFVAVSIITPIYAITQNLRP